MILMRIRSTQHSSSYRVELKEIRTYDFFSGKNSLLNKIFIDEKEKGYSVVDIEYFILPNNKKIVIDLNFPARL